MFTTSTHLWGEDVERGTRVRLTVEGEFNLCPVWTPDGTRVTFASRRDFSPLNLYWKAADGTGEAELLLAREYDKTPSSWSPDGRHLAFHEMHPVTKRDIWILQLDEELTASSWLATPANEHSPRFSPDGRFLAYVSDESGREEVYVQAFPGPGARVPISIEGGREPLWSADGHELFFRHENRVMAVAVTTDPAFVVERPYQLFEGPYAGGAGGGHCYDVAPDGQRFVMVRSEHNLESLQLHVVVNWLEELERLVPKE